jgi:UTP-glucose-1-phosphate uridylyltransferase
MSKPILIVMAAGICSRYSGIKQIDPVGPNGEILLDYSVYDALRCGFGKVVFVIRSEILEAFRERVDPTIGARCEIHYVFQRLEDVPAEIQIPPGRKKPWGTTHAVLACKDFIDRPFAVINADDFYGRTSFTILRQYLNDAQDRDGAHSICIIGYCLDNTLTTYGPVSRAVCTVTPSGYLESMHERKRIRRFGSTIKYEAEDGSCVEISRSSVVSMNMWGFTPNIFEALETRFARFLRDHADDLQTVEYLLPDVVGELVRENKARVQVLSTSDRWFGVTYPEDKVLAREGIEEQILRGIYPENLWATSAS